MATLPTSLWLTKSALGKVSSAVGTKLLVVIKTATTTFPRRENLYMMVDDSIITTVTMTLMMQTVPTITSHNGSMITHKSTAVALLVVDHEGSVRIRVR